MDDEPCFWNNETKELIGSRMNKIRAYLKKKLIRPDLDNPGIYYVDPDTDGNRYTTQTVDIYLETCTCQHYNRDGKECSHILAVKLFKYQVEHMGRNPMEGWIRKETLEKEKTRKIEITEEGNTIFGVQ